MPTTDARTPSPLAPRHLLAGGLVLAALGGSPERVEAQAPERGSWSIGLPLLTENVGSVLNVGFMATSRLQVGLEVDLQAAEAEQDVNRPTLGFNSTLESTDIAVGPTLRWYGSGVGPVVPFLRFRGLYGWGKEKITIGDEPFRETDTRVLAGSLSIGAEWFPIRQLSVSGHTGLEVSRSTFEREDFDGDLIEQTRNQTGTFRSALAVHFYFR